MLLYEFDFLGWRSYIMSLHQGECGHTEIAQQQQILVPAQNNCSIFTIFLFDLSQPAIQYLLSIELLSDRSLMSSPSWCFPFTQTTASWLA